VVVSLLGYFFYVVTAFTAAMVLLISFDESRLMSHNPHPVIAAAPATQSEDQHLPGTAEGQSAKYVAKDIKSSPTIAGAKADSKKPKSSRTIAVAKAVPKKNERKRLAHLDASKVLGTRESSEGNRFIALGYAEGSGYRPGLDSQR
jgi:hypothetical protein